MSKIKLTYKEKDYIAEFSRNTAKAIEERGFSVDLIATQPNKMIPLLIYGAFMKNHSTVKQTKIDEIFLAQNHRGELVGKLAEMYVETVNTLVGDDEDADEKNATWEIV
jgi:hypothetical protein